MYLSFWHAYKNTDLHMRAIYYSWWGKAMRFIITDIFNYGVTSWHVVSTNGNHKPIENSGTLMRYFEPEKFYDEKLSFILFGLWHIAVPVHCQLSGIFSYWSEVTGVTSKATSNPNLYLATKWGDKPVYWPQGWVWGKHDKQPSADSCFNEYAGTHGFGKCSYYSVLCSNNSVHFILCKAVQMFLSLVVGDNKDK